MLVGGIKTKKQLENEKDSISGEFKQRYEVYSPNGISCTITAESGGLGGSGGLYVIENT